MERFKKFDEFANEGLFNREQKTVSFPEKDWWNRKDMKRMVFNIIDKTDDELKLENINGRDETVTIDKYGNVKIMMRGNTKMIQTVEPDNITMKELSKIFKSEEFRTPRQRYREINN
jgi:hypothetical protein